MFSLGRYKEVILLKKPLRKYFGPEVGSCVLCKDAIIIMHPNQLLSKNCCVTLELLHDKKSPKKVAYVINPPWPPER